MAKFTANGQHAVASFEAPGGARYTLRSDKE
jgi:hypothetical protein